MADGDMNPVLKLRENSIKHSVNEHERPMRYAVESALSAVSSEKPKEESHAIRALEKRWSLFNDPIPLNRAGGFCRKLHRRSLLMYRSYQKSLLLLLLTQHPKSVGASRRKMRGGRTHSSTVTLKIKPSYDDDVDSNLSSTSTSTGPSNGTLKAFPLASNYSS